MWGRTADSVASRDLTPYSEDGGGEKRKLFLSLFSLDGKIFLSSCNSCFHTGSSINPAQLELRAL